MESSDWLEDTKFIANIYGMEKLSQFDERGGIFKVLEFPDPPKKDKKKGSDDEEPGDNDLEIDDVVDSEA